MRHCSSHSRACLLTIVLIGAVCCAEAYRDLLQSGCEAGTGGKDCKPCVPGTFSKGGTYDACKSCDLAVNAFCLSMPGPCDTKPSCDPRTGKYAGMCWVAKPAGSTCDMPGAAAGSYVCQGRQCVPKTAGSGAAASKSNGTSQPGPQVLPARCPDTPMCRMAAGPCDMAPPCDANGKPTAMCWVAKPEGAACTVPGSSTAGKCMKDKQCVAAGKAAAAAAAAAANSTKASQPGPQVFPARCPDTPMCRMAAGPCDMAPPCDASGKPTAMCWVAKPEGAACTVPGSSTAGKCTKDKQCVAAGKAAAANSTKASQPGPQVLPARCPDTPMCRMAAGPCDMAPPCDASGKPTAMCWVAKPEGAACTVPGSSTAGKCTKDKQCVA